jgi:hypothetical protein
LATLQIERRKWARLVVKERELSLSDITWEWENWRKDTARWMNDADGRSEELLNLGLIGITTLATLHGIKHSKNMHRTSIAHKDVGINECSR